MKHCLLYTLFILLSFLGNLPELHAQTENCADLIVTIDKQDVAACQEDSGSASVSVEGGVPPYTFLWSTGDTEDFVDSLSTGIYSVLISDSEDCQFTANLVIQNISALHISVTGINTICGLESGAAWVIPEGGTPPYSYEWSNGVVDSSMMNLPMATYNVTVTDSRNCSALGEAVVEVDDYILSPFADLCANEESILPSEHEDGVWTGEGVHFENGQYVFKPIEGIWTYALSYTAGGCPPSEVNMNILPIPDANFQISPQNHLHCLLDGPIIFAVLGDELGDFYINDEYIESNVWTPTQAGLFTVSYEVGNSFGCFNVQEEEFQVIDVFNPNWSLVESDFSLCENNLPIEIQTEMALGSWASDINSEIYEEDGKFFFDADIGNADHGAFSITYQGGGQNCGQAQTHVINVYHVPETPEVLHESNISCASEPIVVEMIGNPAFCNCPLTFNVYAENGELIQEGFTFNEDVVTLNPFVVEGTNVFEVVSVNKFCESEAVEVVIEVDAAIEVSFENTSPNCNNSDGSTTAMASGGAGDYFYSWSNGALGAENEGLISGDYVVIVTDIEGCTTAANTTLTGFNVPIVDLGTHLLIDEGQTIVLDAGNEGADYFWSTGETTQSILVSEAGVYTVTVTNDMACSASDAVSVQIKDDTPVDIPSIEVLNSWQIRPNPLQNQFFMHLDLKQNIDLEIAIFDLIGREIERQNKHFKSGIQTFQLPTRNWASGLYFVVLKSETEVWQKKVFKE